MLGGSETEQSGEGESGTQQAVTGVTTLNDTTAGQAGGGGDAEPTACAPIQRGGDDQNATTTTTSSGAIPGINTTLLWQKEEEINQHPR